MIPAIVNPFLYNTRPSQDTLHHQRRVDPSLENPENFLHHNMFLAMTECTVRIQERFLFEYTEAFVRRFSIL